MSTTTTSPPEDNSGAPAEEPQAQPPASDSQAVSQQPTQESAAPSQDDNAAWLQSKGVDPNDPEAFQKVMQMAINSEKQMTKATQEASALKSSLTGQPVQAEPGVDPVMGEFIQDYRRDKMIGAFKESHSDWQQYDNAMGTLLNEPIQTPYGVFTRAQLVHEGVMSLDDVYYRAKASSPDNTEQIQSQTRTEVLQSLANTQRAGGGAAQASQSNPQPKEVDPVTEAIRRARENG